jgi:hypothetical protein
MVWIMTDRIRTLTVILERDYRDDDVQAVVEAVKMLKGVQAVELGKPVDLADHVAREEARRELRQKLIDILWPKV